MNLTNKFISGMLVTMAVGASVAGAQAVQNSNRNGEGMGARGPLDWEQRVDQMKLVDDGDYNAWKEHMIGTGRQLMADKVTAEDFAKMAELFDTIKAGDYEKAKELGKDLKMPFGLGNGGGRGMHKMGRGENLINSAAFQALSQEVKDQIKAAHDANDPETVHALLEANGLAPAQGKFKDRRGGRNLATGDIDA